MRIATLSEIQSFNSLALSDLFVMRQWWREGQTFTMAGPRTRSAFIYTSGCSITVREQGRESLCVPLGAILYIPEGSVYSLEFKERTERHATVLIEFSLKAEDKILLANRMTVIERAPDVSIVDSMERIVSEFSKPERNYFEIKSKIFKLLSLLCKRENQILISERSPSIERGIRYLESDDAQSLSLDEVAKMCFVTPAYFRRAFRKYAGMSPIEYRNKRKIERAKELLDSTELSVADVSDTLGYDNPSYFCRVFKREVGFTPTFYRSKNSIEK